MTKTAEEFIESKISSVINSEVSIKDISRTCKHYHKVVAVTYMKESINDEKVFEVQRREYLKTVYDDDGRSEIISNLKGDIYRIGYFMVAKIGEKRKGKWIWAQFTPMFWNDDLSNLMQKAKDEGTIL